MKSIAYSITILLMTGLAIPAEAQELSQQEADQVAKSVVESFSKVFHAKDAVGVAALYTDDAIRVTPYGLQNGRAEIEKAFAEALKVYDPDFTKVNQVAVIGKDVVMSVLSYAGTYNGPNGPVAVKGRGTWVEVHDGDGWKIRVETINRIQ
jgi:uncharacterized protein (TIGR02246 family)